jgi:membrane protein implicated in regulation of membrane protease activity
MAGNLSLGWWIATGLLVAGELASGTFFLLMIAIGCAAAALAGHAGASFVVQVIVAAVVGGGAVAAWRRQRRRAVAPVAPAANPDLNLDVGERVHVDAWNADGTARVHYRGSAWNARFVGEGAPQPGAHVIDEVRHNELALRRAP